VFFCCSIQVIDKHIKQELPFMATENIIMAMVNRSEIVSIDE